MGHHGLSAATQSAVPSAAGFVLALVGDTVGPRGPDRSGPAELPHPRHLMDSLGRSALHVPQLHHRDGAPPGWASAVGRANGAIGPKAAGLWLDGAGCRAHTGGVRGAGCAV